MEDNKKIEYEMNYNNFINILSDILLKNQDLFLEAIADKNAVAFLFCFFVILNLSIYNIKTNNFRKNKKKGEVIINEFVFEKSFYKIF